MAARPSLVIAGIVVVAAGAIAVWYLRRPDPASTEPARGAATAVAPAGVAAVPSSPPPRRATKISSDERAQVAERIARARASRAKVAAPAGPSLPATAPALPAAEKAQVEEVATNVQAAMRDVTPFLVECAKQHREALGPATVEVKASMLLDGDPDVGTLITANALEDSDGKALPAGFDDCVRDAMQSLQLPPLAEGSRFKVNYVFEFATEPGDGSEGSAR